MQNQFALSKSKQNMIENLKTPVLTARRASADNSSIQEQTNRLYLTAENFAQIDEIDSKESLPTSRRQDQLDLLAT